MNTDKLTSERRKAHLTPALSPARRGSESAMPAPVTTQPPTVPPQLCVSRVGFAALLDVSVRTVDRMIAADEIPVHRVRGKAVRFLRSDAEKYLEETKRKAEGEKAETSLPLPGPLPPAAAGRRGSRDAKGGTL